VFLNLGVGKERVELRENPAAGRRAAGQVRKVWIVRLREGAFSESKTITPITRGRGLWLTDCRSHPLSFKIMGFAGVFLEKTTGTIVQGKLCARTREGTTPTQEEK